MFTDFQWVTFHLNEKSAIRFSETSTELADKTTLWEQPKGYDQSALICSKMDLAMSGGRWTISSPPKAISHIPPAFITLFRID